MSFDSFSLTSQCGGKSAGRKAVGSRLIGTVAYIVGEERECVGER